MYIHFKNIPLYITGKITLVDVQMTLERYYFVLYDGNIEQM